MSLPETAHSSPQPLSVIRSDVSPIEVGKSYLKAELGRVFSDKNIQEKISQVVDLLQGKEFWRWLEAMSFTLRLNGVFWTVGSEKFSWNEEMWNISKLTLTGVNPAVNKVIYSEKVGQRPFAFRNYLREYFNAHFDDDPQNLNQFRPKKEPLLHPTILLKENSNQIQLLDGTNRLVRMLLTDETAVNAYVARETNPQGKMRIGDSTFLLLRQIYHNAENDKQPSILDTVEILAQMSVDGEEAIQTYWIDQILFNNK